MISKSIARPFFNSLYVAPLSIQSSRFSKLYLGPFSDSPLVDKYFKDSNSASNVFLKEYNNGSKIFLTYGQSDADLSRCRGLALDSTNFDECADIALEALPVAYEAMAASEYAFKRHYGTPKSELNTLEVLFKRGAGCEWVTKCTHCNRWAIPDNLDTCMAMCTEAFGPCCPFCKKPLDVLSGKWVAARPSIRDHLSFHIPRQVLVARTAPKMWGDLRNSVDPNSPSRYSATKIANEVFGLAAGVAGRLLTQREAQACCDPSRVVFDKTWPQDGRSIVSCVLGVDWSVTAGVASYTVITVLGYDYTGKAYNLYSERLNGIQILDQVRRVEQLALLFRVQMIATDRGVGQLQYELLKKTFGAHKVIAVQYCAAKLMLRYDQQGGFIAADRTQIMDMVFLKMKLGKAKFETPSWETMQKFWPDALSIFEEVSLSGRKLFRKDEGSTDDWFHSVVFAHVGWMCVTGQFDFLDQLTYTQEEETQGFPYDGLESSF